MDNVHLTDQAIALQQRKKLLIETLSKARSESSDVTLVCGEVEFPVHKLVLEASSSYFQAMFRSGLEESKTGRVVFKDVEPKTLETILNFIYFGDLAALNSEEQVKKVLIASHLMQIKSLCQYCCNALASSLSPDNFYEVWILAQKYEDEDLLTRLCCYWITNTNDMVSSMAFLYLPIDLVKDLLNFVKENLLCWDKVLVGILNWLRYDVEDRQEFIEDLLDVVDENHLSYECWKSCLRDEIVISSEDMTNKLLVMAPTYIRKQKLLFFSDFCVTEKFDQKCQVMRRSGWCFVQQFDVDTMMWLPHEAVCIRDFYGPTVTLGQYKNRVCLVGGLLGNLYAMYDVESNTIDYLENNLFTFDSNQEAAMCEFKGNLYVIGKQPRDDLNQAIFTVYYAKPNSSEWKQAKSLKYGRTSPTVLATAHYIYVIGGNCHFSGLKIEYNSCPENCHWEKIPTPAGLFARNFCVTGGKLHGLCCASENLLWLTYDHVGKLWLHQSFRIDPEIVPVVTRVCQFPDTPSPSPYVLFSTLTPGFQIPNFLWKPGTGELMKLPLPKGQCRIPDCEIRGIRAVEIYTVDL